MAISLICSDNVFTGECFETPQDTAILEEQLQNLSAQGVSVYFAANSRDLTLSHSHFLSLKKENAATQFIAPEDVNYYTMAHEGFFSMATEKYNLNAQETLFISASKNQIAQAQECGYPTILADNLDETAQVIQDKISQLQNAYAV